MNDEMDLEMPIAKNAPGFDGAPGPDKGGDDRVYDFSADLNISPVKDIGERDENGVLSSVPIQIVTKKFHSANLPPKVAAPISTPVTAASVPATTPEPSVSTIVPPLAEVSTKPAPSQTSSILPTTPGQEPRPTDVERPIVTPTPSNIPNREKIFSPQPVTPPSAPTPSVNVAAAPIQKETPPVFQPSKDQFTVPEPTPTKPPQPTVFVAPKPKPIPTFNLDGSLVTAPAEPASTIPPGSKIPLDPNLKPLRTYENDVAQAMAREQASVAAIAIAEAKKRQETQPEGQVQESAPSGGGSAKKIFIVLLIIVFIGTGVIGAFYLYSKSPLAPSPTIAPTQQAPASLIPSDSYALFSMDNLAPLSIKHLIR